MLNEYINKAVSEVSAYKEQVMWGKVGMLANMVMLEGMDDVAKILMDARESGNTQHMLSALKEKGYFLLIQEPASTTFYDVANSRLTLDLSSTELILHKIIAEA